MHARNHNPLFGRKRKSAVRGACADAYLAGLHDGQEGRESKKRGDGASAGAITVKRYKGFDIRRVDGEYIVPKIDPESVFESLKDAEEFVAEEVKMRRNPAKFDRCVKHVQARGGDVNAYAVCTAAGTRDNPRLDWYEKGYKAAAKLPKRVRDYPTSYANEVRDFIRKQDDKIADAYKGDFWDHGDPRGEFQSGVWDGLYGVRKKYYVYSWVSGGRYENETPVSPGFDSESKARQWITKNLSRDEYYRGGKEGRGYTVHATGERQYRENPEPAAAELYETFHGRPPEEIITVREDLHVHGWETTLGILLKLDVDTESGYEASLEFPDPEQDRDPKDWVYLTSSEDGKQYFLAGGDQALDLHALHMDGKEWVRDSMVIGRITVIDYVAEKVFDQGEGIQQPYTHKVGAEIVNGRHRITTKVQPTLIYDTRNNLLSIAGGQYHTDQWIKR